MANDPDGLPATPGTAGDPGGAWRGDDPTRAGRSQPGAAQPGALRPEGAPPAGGAAAAPVEAVEAAAGWHRLDPRVVHVWMAGGAIATVIVVLALAGAELIVRLAGAEVPWPPAVPALVVAVAGALLSWRLPRLAYRHWSYGLAADALELRQGVLWRTRSAIPYWRVQYIDVKQGPVERAIGLSRLVVHTAAATTDAEVPGIAAERAEALRRVLLERAGSGDAV